MAFKFLANTAPDEYTSITLPNGSTASGYDTQNIVSGPRSTWWKGAASANATSIGYNVGSSTPDTMVVARADKLLSLIGKDIDILEWDTSSWAVLETPKTPLTRADLIGISSQDYVESFTPTETAGFALRTTPKANCADFERSSSDTMHVADNASLSITGNITLSAWVKFESVAAFQAIIAKYGTAGNRSYWLGLDSGSRIDFTLSNDGTAITTREATTFGALSTGTWYHVTGRYNGSNMYCTVNNTTDSTAYASGIFDGAEGFYLGTQQAGVGNPFDGVMRNAAVWGASLSDASVDRLYDLGPFVTYDNLPSTLKNNLVSWWNLDEISDGSGAVPRIDSHGSNDLTDDTTVPSARTTGTTAESMLLSKLFFCTAFSLGVEPALPLIEQEIARNADDRRVRPLRGDEYYATERTINLRFAGVTAAKVAAFEALPNLFTWPLFLWDDDASVWAHKLEHVIIVGYEKTRRANGRWDISLQCRRLEHYV